MRDLFWRTYAPEWLLLGLRGLWQHNGVQLMIVLGIDPSMRSLGWAVGQPGDVPKTGIEVLGKSGEHQVRVWRNAVVWLSKFIAEHQPDVIAIEAPFLTSAPKDGEKGISNPKTINVLNGVNGHLHTIAFMKTGNFAETIYPGSARKALTGTGKFPRGQAKAEVHKACVSLGWAASDDGYDITDALAIWVAAAINSDPEFASNFTPLMRAE